MRRRFCIIVTVVAGLGMGRWEARGGVPAGGVRQGEGIDGRVLRLDGKTAAMRVKDSDTLHSFVATMTIEVWFKAESFPTQGGNVCSLVRKNINVGEENFYLRFRIVDGGPAVEFNPGGAAGTLRVPYDFKPGRWYHLAAVYNGMMLGAYVNGQNIETQFGMGGIGVDKSDLYIGRGDPDFSEGEYFHGEVDEIRIWKVARKPAELKANINRALTGKEEGLVAYWNFDDGKARDLTPNGNDGEIEKDAQIIEATRPKVRVQEEPRKTPVAVP